MIGKKIIPITYTYRCINAQFSQPKKTDNHPEKNMWKRKCFL